MNAVAVERAWSAVLAPVVATLVCLPGTSDAVLANTDSLVMVDCEKFDHSAGKYWRAEISVVVDSPALAEDPLPAHVAAFEALANYFADPAGEGEDFPETLTPILEAFPRDGLDLNGLFVRSSEPRRNGLRWQGVVSFVVGHSKSATV